MTQFLHEMATTMMDIAYEWSFLVEDPVVVGVDSVAAVVDSGEGMEVEEVVAEAGVEEVAAALHQDGQITEPSCQVCVPKGNENY